METASILTLQGNHPQERREAWLLQPGLGVGLIPLS